MNRHFEDARYYLERAGTHVKLGLTETAESVENWVREVTGREKEPEPGRVESLLEEAKRLEERAESEAREALGGARERIEGVRQGR